MADDHSVDTLNRAFENRVRTSRVFILGAGFSAGAGIPLTADLMIDAMRIADGEASGVATRIRRHIDTCFNLRGGDPDLRSLSMSDICTYLHYLELRERQSSERFSARGSRELLALRFCLAKAVAQKTPAGALIPDVYLRFARQLEPRDRVISFNWDCLLENALEAVGKRYAYHFSNDKIRILKMHGSVHWCIGHPATAAPLVKPGWTPTFEWVPLDVQLIEGAKALSTPVAAGGKSHEVPQPTLFVADQLVRPGAWASQRPFGEIHPMIVLPGFGKAADVERIASLWAVPEWNYPSTHDVYIIGLCLAPDDFLVRSFFLDNLPYIEASSGIPGRRIVVVNPDPMSKHNYSFLLGTPNVEFVCERFGVTHVSRMEESSAAARGSSAD